MDEIARKTWGDARRLLVELAKTLAPLADSSPELSPVQITLFIPPRLGDKTAPFKRTAQNLLPKLREVQQQVSGLIEVLNEDSSFSPTAKGIDQMRASPEPLDWKRAVFTNQAFRSPFMTKSETLPQTIMAPAQKAIDQVRGAIRVLATSLHFEQTNVAPLRKVLEKIGPTLNQLVAAVESHQGTGFGKEEKSPSTFIVKSQKSAREEILFKEGRGEPQRIIQGRSRQKPVPISHSIKIEVSSEKGSRQSSVQSKQEENQIVSSTPQSTQTKTLSSSERTVLPAAPFTPIFTSSAHLKKKKRKLFPWEKEDDEDSLRDKR